jgi:serpin B
MVVPFTPGADFERICRDLYISEVKHKSFVEVNEEGTEAAAVTSIGFTLTMEGPTVFYMVVNRPFLFVIWERQTKAVLFIGAVADPNASE